MGVEDRRGAGAVLAAPRVVLGGAGHAHLHTLKHAGRLVGRGAAVTVVAPGPLHYSGMAAGVLGGRYAAGANRIDVEALTRRAGARFVASRIARIDAGARAVDLVDGSRLPYDVLSLNLGSGVLPLPGPDDRTIPARPVHGLDSLAGRLDAHPPGAARLRVVVVGGGATGCEVAANAVRRAGERVHATLVAGGPLLEGWPAAARRRARRALERGGVEIIDAAAVAVEPAAVRLGDGSRLPADVVVNATGLHAPAVYASSALPVDAAGRVRTDAYLRVRGRRDILAGGDSIEFDGRVLPAVGVHAVRQAPVLLNNIAAIAFGGRLRRFRPQARTLLILNLGHTGIAARGRLVIEARYTLALKDAIDRRFVDAYGRAGV
jgi:NADH dehydrogenase FAD-containing subunit